MIKAKKIAIISTDMKKEDEIISEIKTADKI